MFNVWITAIYAWNLQFAEIAHMVTLLYKDNAKKLLNLGSIQMEIFLEIALLKIMIVLDHSLTKLLVKKGSLHRLITLDVNNVMYLALNVNTNQLIALNVQSIII